MSDQAHVSIGDHVGRQVLVCDFQNLLVTFLDLLSWRDIIEPKPSGPYAAVEFGDVL